MARRNAWLRPEMEDGAEVERLDLSPLEGDEGGAEEEVVEVEAIVLFEPASLGTPLQAAGRAADEAAARGLFAEYQERLAPHTRRRQVADLACFAAYLEDAGVPVGDLRNDPAAWAGVTWGLVKGFARWQLQRGYAVGSINVRLATVKRYCQLGATVGTVAPEALALIQQVRGYRRKEARHVDEAREVTRVGDKKAQPVSLTPAQAALLKSQPETAQGRRDALLMCLLLDHGLRCGEVAGLKVEAFDLEAGTLTFYREKVDIVQMHRLTRDTWRAARAYLSNEASATGPLLRSSRKDGQLTHQGMSVRAITKRVALLGEQLGIAGLSAHDCRHFWATDAIRNGTDIKSLQDAGGWASPHMPLRYAESATIANEGVRLSEKSARSRKEYGEAK